MNHNVALFHLHTKDSTDEELMTRVKGGSRRAFDELYHRYAHRLNGFFFSQLGGWEAMPKGLPMPCKT